MGEPRKNCNRISFCTAGIYIHPSTLGKKSEEIYAGEHVEIFMFLTPYTQCGLEIRNPHVACMGVSVS